MIGVCLFICIYVCVNVMMCEAVPALERKIKTKKKMGKFYFCVFVCRRGGKRGKNVLGRKNHPRGMAEQMRLRRCPKPQKRKITQPRCTSVTENEKGQIKKI